MIFRQIGEWRYIENLDLGIWMKIYIRMMKMIFREIREWRYIENLDLGIWIKSYIRRF